MATIRVSSNSQLKSALNSADSGTEIELSSGTYSLSSTGGDYHNAVITEAAGANAKFSSVQLTDTKNLTFDGVTFQLPAGQRGIFIQGGSNITIQNADLNGATTNGSVGVMVSKSNGFTLEDSHFTGFETATKFTNITDLTVTNNTWSNVSWDAMIIGSVHKALFQNNDISMNVPSGRLHTDAMQFYNTGTKVASSDVTIRDNTIHAPNYQSHGIYINNELVNDGADRSHYYQDFTIEGNTIISGDGLGLSVGQTDNVDIHGNIVLRDPALSSSKEMPTIHIATASTDVSVTGNVTHKVPMASGSNWQTVTHSSADWTIADNPIIRVGASLAEAQAMLASSGGASRAAPSAAIALASTTVANDSAATLAVTSDSGSQGETFRFYGDNAAHVHADGLDFAAGDTLALRGFDAGTFHGHGGELHISTPGAGTQIGSLDDLRALDVASGKVSVHTSGDTLVIDIAQRGQDHVIELGGLGHAYAYLI